MTEDVHEVFPFDPDWTIAPGATLQEELTARKMTQQDLADDMDRPPQAINEIIKGKKAITYQTALQLEKALGISAEFWMNLETRYRLDLLRGRKRIE